MRHAIVFLLILSGCSTVTRDPNSNWIKEWNSGGSLEDKETIARKMEAADYIRLHREAVGVLDKSAPTTPPDPLEREMVYFVIASGYMNAWQSALYGNTSDRAGLLQGVPHLRERANVYMRKLMELPNLHEMSKFLIARIQELDGNSYASTIGIERGAKFWIFTFHVARGRHTFLLDDFRKDYKRIPIEKRGGGGVTVARTVCAGLVLCYAGMRYDDELVINELNNLVGVRVVYDGHKGKITGKMEYGL
jgi:hypothetical protein